MPWARRHPLMAIPAIVTRIQRYSSYTFTVFASIHLANTSVFPLIYKSVPYSEPLLVMAREAYQTPYTEPLLVGLPLVAHIVSGVAIRLIRRSQNLQRYGGANSGMYALARSRTDSSTASSNSKNGLRIWPAINYVSISGYVLLAPLASHIFMNRILPLMVEGDSSNIGLQYVAHGFALHKYAPWIAYTALLGVGVGHMVWGWAKWLDVAPPHQWKKTTFDKQLRKKRRRAWWTINSIAVLITGVWAAGGLGVVARAGLTEGWLGTVYDNIYSYGP